MSDTDKSKNPTEHPHNETEEWRKTQIVKRPKLRPRSESEAEEDGEPEVVKHTNILSSDNPLLRRALNQNASVDPNGTTSVGNSREVILLIRGMIERLVLKEGVQYQLGRFEFSKPEDHHIDLTPYGAGDRGVSRVHAHIH